MIIRTYQRRNRSGRSLSDSGNPYGDGVGSSGSQESLWGGSQEPSPFSFPSSQESCWSQSDYGNSTRSFKSSRRQSQEDDFINNIPAAVPSRPPMSRLFSEKPPLNWSRRIDDGKAFSRKLKKTHNDFPDLYSNGTGAIDRKRSSDVYKRDSQENGARNSKARRESSWGNTFNNASSMWGFAAAPTATLMEAQESGEMMEHVDEANFALDGLRQGQPVRIQRASLTSLLSLCGSMQRRRMLRTHGMAKPLLDAIVALPTDDPPLALAAAAVLYFLASDSHDEDLLDSEPCVLFLMKLLGTRPSQPTVKKGLSAIGSRLAALSKSSLHKSGTQVVKGVDRGASVITQVRDLFKSLQEHGAGGNSNEENGMLLGGEISSRWLALLTLEKACISTVVLEDSTAEAVRKVGGRFKERLRELGGLDAVCELAASCLVNLKEALKTEDADEIVDLNLALLEKNEKSGGVGVLLRCLRVMENVTFLSEKNQKHLLEMKLSRGKLNGTESFIGLTINAVNTLSELAQRLKERKESLAKQRRLASLANGKLATKLSPIIEGIEPYVELKCAQKKVRRQRSLADFFPGKEDIAVNGTEESEKAELSSSDKNGSSLITFQRRKSSKFAMSGRSQSTSVTSIGSMDTESEGQNNGKSKSVFFKRKKPATSQEDSQKSVDGSGNEYEFSKQLDAGLDRKARKTRWGPGNSSLEDSPDPFGFDVADKVIKSKDKERSSIFEDSQDPCAIDDVDFDWKNDKVNKKKLRTEKVGMLDSTTRKERTRSRLGASAEEHEDLLETSGLVEESDMLARGNPEGQDEENRQGTLLGDCLLSGVKVLMNLTNGNPVGCSQVASYDGFKSLSSLLIANYPWPRSPVSVSDSPDSFSEDGLRQHCGEDLDQDLDLLVTVLGVLCNLVEKDVSNRARLASLEVTVPSDITSTREGKLWEETGMIGLLCSLFLMKQGAGEAAEAIECKRALEMDEEVKQGQAEAEDMIVEAYTALLLAFLSKESERARRGIAKLLPGDNLKVLVPVLERFVAFHLSLNMISEETHAVVKDVIDSCKQPIFHEDR